MRLHQPYLVKRLGKQAAKPLNWLACARWIYPLARMADVYLDFLIGKGSGTGWDLHGEVRGAVLRIRCPRSVDFDVRAEVGSWIQNLLQLVPVAKVYMFAPSPRCRAAICGKNLPGATIAPCALGETPGGMHFYTGRPPMGAPRCTSGGAPRLKLSIITQ